MQLVKKEFELCSFKELFLFDDPSKGYDCYYRCVQFYFNYTSSTKLVNEEWVFQDMSPENESDLGFNYGV